MIVIILKYFLLSFFFFFYFFSLLLIKAENYIDFIEKKEKLLKTNLLQHNKKILILSLQVTRERSKKKNKQTSILTRV